MQRTAVEDLVCICGNLDPCVCGLHCPEPFDRIGYSIAESEATSKASGSKKARSSESWAPANSLAADDATDVDKSHSES